LLTGRKLLLADDSIAIQKVIDLTFTDEGMKVTIVGDGDQALERLQEMAPDIVLADVTMPGVNGYELCRMIRENERLSAIPVMLLVGSFEPFDEAEARRVGANDVVTKPFQSIRDLVSRVGSLLGNEAATDAPAHQYSTLGLGRTSDESQTTSADELATEPDLKVMVEAPEVDSMQDENVTVLVEAASIDEHEAADAEGVSCATDVEMQTADTRKLERIDDEELGSSFTPSLYAQDDTIEIEPLRVAEKAAEEDDLVAEPVPETVSIDTIEMEAVQPVAPLPSTDMFSDTLLDLDYLSSPAQPASREGVVLDLDFEDSAITAPARHRMDETNIRPAASAAGLPAAKVATTESLVETAAAAAQAHEWAIVPATPAEKAAPVAMSEEDSVAPADQAAALKSLSPETIDAIAKRVVEQMSEKIVREIAWEVVPELAELLIKKKLEEEKS